MAKQKPSAKATPKRGPNSKATQPVSKGKGRAKKLHQATVSDTDENENEIEGEDEDENEIEGDDEDENDDSPPPSTPTRPSGKRKRPLKVKAKARSPQSSPVTAKSFQFFDAPPTERHTKAQVKRFKIKAAQATTAGKLVSGVWRYEENVQDNLPELAGYLNLTDTHELDRFMKSIKQDVLQPLLDLRNLKSKDGEDCSYGIQGRKSGSHLFKDKLFALLWDKEFSKEQRAVIESGTFPIKAKDLGIQAMDPRIVYANWFGTMIKIIESQPHLFASKVDHDVTKWLHTNENWSRAEAVIRYWFRSNTKARVGKGTRSKEKTPAVKPFMLTPSDLEKALEEESGEAAVADDETAHAIRSMEEDIANANGDSSGDESLDDQAEEDFIQSAQVEIDKVVFNRKSQTANGAMRTNNTNDPLTRPPLTPADRLKLSKIFSGYARVKFDKLSRRGTAPTLALGAIARATNVAEGIFGDENVFKDADVDQIAQFWAMQKKLSSVSAKTPGFKESCAITGVDPSDLALPGTDLFMKAWQVMDVAWMLQQENTTLGGGLVASDCGTGKTYTMLALIRLAYEKLKEKKAKGPFGVTIVQSPSALVSHWIEQYESKMSGSLDIHQFYGSEKTVEDDRRSILMGTTVEDLNIFLNNLDVNDVETAKIVIFTSYSTFGHRAVDTIAPKGKKGPKRNDKNREDDEAGDDEDGDDEDGDDEGDDSTGDADSDGDDGEEEYEYEFADGMDIENPEMAAKMKKRVSKGYKVKYQTKVHTKNIFRLICDEAHYIKNPRTQGAESARQLFAAKKWFLTATPALNKLVDYRGYLFQLWNESWKGLQLSSLTPLLEIFKLDFNPRNVPKYDRDGNLMGFYDAMPDYDEGTADFNDAVDAGVRLYLLDPNTFRKIGIDTNWDLDTANTCLKAMLPIFQLRRTMESFVDLEDGSAPFRVGEDIPAYTVTTVKLGWPSHLRPDYDAIANKFMSKLNGGELNIAPIPTQGNSEKDSIVNADATRQMSHACFDLDLQHLTRNVKKTQKKRSKHEKAVGGVDAINKWRELDHDNGVSFKMRMSRKDKTYPVYSNRAHMADTIAQKSPKICWLLGYLAEHCLGENPEKVLIMNQYPMPQWDLEGMLALLGFKVLSIRASHTTAERRKIMKKFNDPNYKCHCLIIGMKLGAYGLDFHTDCSKMVIMELPSNIGTLIQAFGRIHRVGQKFPQEITILTMEDSYDTYLQVLMATKFLPQISGEGDLENEAGRKRFEEAGQTLKQLLGQEEALVGYSKDEADATATPSRKRKQAPGSGPSERSAKKLRATESTKLLNDIANEEFDIDSDDSDDSA